MDRKNLKKRCNCCEENLTLENFGPKKRGYLGVKAQCKKCLSEREKLRRAEDSNYYQRNKEQSTEWKKRTRSGGRKLPLKIPKPEDCKMLVGERLKWRCRITSL